MIMYVHAIYVFNFGPFNNCWFFFLKSVLYTYRLELNANSVQKNSLNKSSKHSAKEIKGY